MASIWSICALSFVSITNLEHTSAYICATPKTETCIPAASIYCPAGPLNDLLPMIGLTAITFLLFFDNSFLTPFIPSIGPILVNGLPGAIITSSES